MFLIAKWAVGALTFNRTSMELKPDIAGQGYQIETTFNRTSMELKLLFVGSLLVKVKTFNRTSMELKLTL